MEETKNSIFYLSLWNSI